MQYTLEFERDSSFGYETFTLLLKPVVRGLRSKAVRFNIDAMMKEDTAVYDNILQYHIDAAIADFIKEGVEPIDGDPFRWQDSIEEVVAPILTASSISTGHAYISPSRCYTKDMSEYVSELTKQMEESLYDKLEGNESPCHVYED